DEPTGVDGHETRRGNRDDRREEGRNPERERDHRAANPTRKEPEDSGGDSLLHVRRVTVGRPENNGPFGRDAERRRSCRRCPQAPGKGRRQGKSTKIRSTSDRHSRITDVSTTTELLSQPIEKPGAKS